MTSLERGVAGLRLQMRLAQDSEGVDSDWVEVDVDVDVDALSHVAATGKEDDHEQSRREAEAMIMRVKHANAVERGPNNGTWGLGFRIYPICIDARGQVFIRQKEHTNIVNDKEYEAYSALDDKGKKLFDEVEVWAYSGWCNGQGQDVPIKTMLDLAHSKFVRSSGVEALCTIFAPDQDGYDSSLRFWGVMNFVLHPAVFDLNRYFELVQRGTRNLNLNETRELCLLQDMAFVAEAAQDLKDFLYRDDIDCAYDFFRWPGGNELMATFYYACIRVAMLYNYKPAIVAVLIFRYFDTFPTACKCKIEYGWIESVEYACDPYRVIVNSRIGGPKAPLQVTTLPMA